MPLHILLWEIAKNVKILKTYETYLLSQWTFAVDSVTIRSYRSHYRLTTSNVFFYLNLVITSKWLMISLQTDHKAEVHWIRYLSILNSLTTKSIYMGHFVDKDFIYNMATLTMVIVGIFWSLYQKVNFRLFNLQYRRGNYPNNLTKLVSPEIISEM